VVALARKTRQAGERIRVLIIDDSAVIRQLVTHALAKDPSIEVVGTAVNGSTGLARIAQLHPDVILLDVEMPDMDGLEMLRRMRNDPARPRVLLFSTLTRRGAEVTLDALALGADDYVTKALNAGAELLPKIKQFFLFPADPSRAAPVLPTPPVGRAARPPEVLAIGVSTGGPNALTAILPQLPPDFPLPILIVQHMPPVFTRFLAERLQTCTSLKVEEATDATSVIAGSIFIAPGDHHMQVRRNNGKVMIKLDQSPPENSCRPSVDALFRSVAAVYGHSAVAAIFTGQGQDGTLGAKVLNAHGAYLIAQDQVTSVVWGMPGSVVASGLADCVVPLERVVPEVLKRLGKK